MVADLLSAPWTTGGFLPVVGFLSKETGRGLFLAPWATGGLGQVL